MPDSSVVKAGYASDYDVHCFMERHTLLKKFKPLGLDFAVLISQISFWVKNFKQFSKNDSTTRNPLKLMSKDMAHTMVTVKIYHP